ncbi:Transcription-associated protein 1 [Cyberlindnera fabianii]|uniref:Transcription-associated protein 1 n=1 Tax=Cyberlindnera fabianii TaxID=36022 RepID=A0A1V2L0D7_CYBFA|nr:Transcription-associated protein 1 [Cyberlindnera fabianii]
MEYTQEIDKLIEDVKGETNYDVKLSELLKLIDRVESFTNPAEYEHYLSNMLPVYIDLLNSVPISFESQSSEHKLRNALLEAVHRAQMNETFEKYVLQLNDLLQGLIRKENEANGVLCLKIVTSMFKTYKTLLTEQAVPFVELMIEIYKNTEQLVTDTFVKGTSPQGKSTDSFSLPSLNHRSADDPKVFADAMHSFKTLSECPISMVSMTSSYKQLVTSHLPEFVNWLMAIMKLEVPQQKEARRIAEEKGERLSAMSPTVKHRAAYGDFITAQVKAASLISYTVIRGHVPQLMQENSTLIPDLYMRVLQDCPSELPHARREVLHSIRHILTTPDRTLFIPKLDLMFDEKVLIGDSLTAYETLRPLAYSVVADFVHNVRGEISTDKILQALTMYCKHLQDNSFALTVQIMSAKLLLNLAERILRFNNKQEGRQLFMLLIDAFTKRFQSLNRQYDNIMKRHHEMESKKQKKEKEQQELLKRENLNYMDADDEINEFMEKTREIAFMNSSIAKDNKVDGDGDVEMDGAADATEAPTKRPVDDFDVFDIQRELPISSTAPINSDPLKDARYLFRTLLQFLRTSCYGLKSFNPPPKADVPAQKWNESARVFSNEEVNILRQLFRECIAGLRFFASPQKPQPKQDKHILESIPLSSSKEEKDLMECFAIVFIQLDPATFNEIVVAEIGILYQSILRDSSLLYIPQFFLANENTSPNFSGLLLSFLKGKLEILGSSDIVQTNVLIRLFKLCFMSVNLFPTLNEKVLLPHLNDLILTSLKLTTTAKEPLAYFHLIRTIFRSIGGGRFESLYKEIMPLLQVLLESLNRMILNARRPQERDIYVELCLIVPVRLNGLVPHLTYLMRPLVLALNSSQELVSQGLRTLELCVDNLTAEYFDPIIEPVIKEVMEALWKHLKPLPYHHQHSHTAFRILGKLGGRNRRFIKPHQDLSTVSSLEQDINAKFKIEGLPGLAPLSVTTGIKSAIEILEDGSLDNHYRVSAFKYVSKTFMLFISTDKIPEDYASKLAAAVELISQDKLDSSAQLKDGELVSKPKLNREQELALKLLKALFYAISIPEVKDEAMTLLKNVTEHLTLLSVGKVLTERIRNERPFVVDDSEGIVVFSERILFDAIIYALGSYMGEVRAASTETVKIIFDTCVTIFGSTEKALTFPHLRSLFNAFIHYSYDEAFYNKLASTLGIKALVEDLGIPISWFKPRQFDLIRSMFYVLRDTNPEAPHEVCDTAKQLILKVLVEANTGMTQEQVLEKPFQTIIGSLVYDLSNANPIVRETSQEALKAISTTTNVPVATMIEKCQNILLPPIFGKPLRALPFPMQIGNIDAITFCLSLENSFLVFNDELNRLLLEALTLVDAEDESLTSAHKISEHRTSEQLVKLRVVCIKLLSLALTREDFPSNQQSHTRIRILAVFFKTLCAKSTDIINASHKGLKLVLDQNAKIPKELLQNGLRPMLMNLSDHKKLTVSGLEALARLLELLLSYFKVEIGRKLLDHLRAWARTEVLYAVSSEDLDHNPTVKVMVAILNIFHLLPDKAFGFMDEMIQTLSYIEEHLRRCQGSPLRAPIAKFLNRFPNETYEYFLKHFASRDMGTKLAYFVALPDCEKMRQTIQQNIGSFYNSVAQETVPENKCYKFSNFIELMSSLARVDKPWIIQHKQLLLDISSLSREVLSVEQKAVVDSPLHFCVKQELEQLQDLFVCYFESNIMELDIVFGFIDLICSLDIPVSPRLEDFLFESVVKSDNSDMRQEYLNKAVVFAADNKSLKSKKFVLRNVFNSIVLYEGMRSGNLDGLSTRATGVKVPIWVDLVHQKIWKASGDIITNEAAGSVDVLRFELLQLTALLTKYGESLINDIRKDVIRYTWNYLKLADNFTKQAAYVAVSYFIATFETPDKLVLQVFVAMLRNKSVDGRFMIKQGLDILAPVMPKRMSTMGSSTGWIRWVRRVLSENNTANNLTVYQLLIRHSEIFYVARDHFIPNMVTCMGKLTSVSNPSAENQTLAIELAELILDWEVRARVESHQIKDDSETTKSSEQEPSTKEDENLSVEDQLPEGDIMMSDAATPSDYSIPLLQRETCVQYLIRFVCVSSQRASETELGQKALRILNKLMSSSLWPDVNVDLSFFEKFLVQADFNIAGVLGYCLNALDVLGICLEGKPSEWIVENISYVQTLLEKCLRSENHDVQQVLQRVLKIVLRAITKETGTDDKAHSEDVKSFLTLLSTIVAEDLTQTGSVAAGVTMAWTLANYYPKSLDPLVQSLIRTFAKVCKDHISISQTPDSSNAQVEFEQKMTTKLLEKLLCISAMRISTLGDQRRIFLTLLAQLIDRSLDIRLLKNIITIVRSWVFSKTDLFPTTKEKAAILVKMLVFELRGELSLSKEFYQIVVDIFEDKSLACSELTVRMEQPFLVGTRLQDVPIRQRLMSILNDSLDKDINKRLYYVTREQNWEFLADYRWLNQALQLLYGAFDGEHVLKLDGAYQFASFDQLVSLVGAKNGSIVEGVPHLLEKHNLFIQQASSVKTADILEPLIDLFYKSPDIVHATWVNVFPVAYSSIHRREKQTFKEVLVALLSKDYHSRQADARPNVIQTLLEGIGKCSDLQLPPHLVKYLGYSFDAWYPSIKMLEAIETEPLVENNIVRETNQDALIEMYATLQEDDMFYGQWRRRAKYFETNAALSYEQIGLWDKALQLYEAAQIKARSGVLPYGESEYSLWEDNWILCAEKLQHWDILTELAKHEGFTDLLLECGWRVADWTADRDPLEQSVKTVMDVPTPRRQIFETFLCLQGYSQQKENLQDLSKLCDEGIQLALRKWHALPKRFTNAHIPLLHTLQQYAEFMEASQVYGSLLTTNATNLDNKSQELKRVLQAWRERLPNVWDDINIWNDLVTWRQHAFGVINRVYMTFIPALQQANGNSNANSHAYRGYHEIAWVINRFAHVARKHNMPDVCISQLTKIYTLPNIEIHEAFLKLREQAKCHYQNPNELNTGLDVISNTNLVYFATQQKAEFFTLKGMFLAKLKAQDEANQAFATAVQIDLNLAKAWAEWGHFNDRRLKENPAEMHYANNAISCYLQAAGLYKNAKARTLLCRILWLISLDDSNGALSQAFESYRGEVPVWYWITFIPQLLTSLSHKEAKLVRQILIRIAKTYPQALHFQLRTTHEDFTLIKKQANEAAAAAARQNNKAANNGANNGSGNGINNGANNNTNNNANTGANNGAQSTPGSQQGSNTPGVGSQGINGTANTNGQNGQSGNRQPWEYIEEIMGILKTAYPLLALSLESLVDQISHRFKTSLDEDAYRLILALTNDAVSCLTRLANPRDDSKLPPNTQNSIERFAEQAVPPHMRPAFRKDFIEAKPNIESYCKKLRRWRDRIEDKIDRRYAKVNLETLCPHLSEFHHQKFEDIEVPGQYLLNKDNNSHFIKIERFLSSLDLVRSANSCHKRLHIRGNDGSLHLFAVQAPSPRHSRREERIFQLYRIFNDTLSKKVQTRRRNIQLTLPVAIPLSPQIRIFNETESTTTLLSVYEDFCRKKKMSSDQPLIFHHEKMRDAFDPALPKPDIIPIKVEILASIQATIVPNNLVKNYFAGLYTQFEDFWLFRKQFTSQWASFIFMTFMLCINGRQPHRIFIDEKSGAVTTFEMFPSKMTTSKTTTNFFANTQLDINSQRAAPIIFNGEPVPFRLTPNIQELIGEAGLEGILSVHMLVIAKALVEPEPELATFLPLFIRDEMISWYTQQRRAAPEESHLREIVSVNVDMIIKRVQQLCNVNSSNAVTTQHVLEQIQQAVNPRNLASCDPVWMPYL